MQIVPVDDHAAPKQSPSYTSFHVVASNIAPLRWFAQTTATPAPSCATLIDVGFSRGIDATASACLVI